MPSSWSAAAGPRIIYLLNERPSRFAGLQARLPDITPRMLTERLRELEAEGIIERRTVSGSPTTVEYALLRKGRELSRALEGIGATGPTGGFPRTAPRRPADERRPPKQERRVSDTRATGRRRIPMLPVPMLAVTALVLTTGCKKEAVRPALPPAEVGIVTVGPAPLRSPTSSAPRCSLTVASRFAPGWTASS